MNTLYVKILMIDGSSWFASSFQMSKTAEGHIKRLNLTAKRLYGKDAAIYSLATAAEYWAYRKTVCYSGLTVSV